MKRAMVLVADGLGVGELPDAEKYGDCGSNTLGHVAESVSGFRLPNLHKLGIGHLGKFQGIAPIESPQAIVGRLAERSLGKDTITGHWELAGLLTENPFLVYKEFPKKLLEAIGTASGVSGFLGNFPASGTEIVQALGEEHLRTGKPILYTSADSVFQLAAHEKHFGLEALYRLCEQARKFCDDYQIGRVIARPFLGEKAGSFTRTENRRDYSVPPERNLLDVLQENGIGVNSVGKIEDIFCHRGISASDHTGNNRDSLESALSFFKKDKGQKSFTFVNLVDFDQLYGHRRDAKGYAQALVKLDAFLPQLLSDMESEDLLILTGDHGCDPTFKGTDHTREYVPLVAYSPGISGSVLGTGWGFGDVAATLLSGYGLSFDQMPSAGQSFVPWKSIHS